ncbi:hypothetical protein [Streptomyces abikoensis]|uniref:Uncharacterized protein n=1 Tax=Streptomyces abikoensis TaxID=97398 RepID=A0ABW7TAU6_9ACTN
MPWINCQQGALAERVGSQLRLATALRDVRVRDLALRTQGLSPAALDAVPAIVDEARKVQNLSSVTDDGPPADARPCP